MTYNHFFINAFWVPFAVASILLSLMIYGAVQQNYRGGANDPQIQIAEDAAKALEAGETPDMIVPATEAIDISATLAPFLAIYDTHGKPVVSSGLLYGNMPEIPAGIFAYTKTHGEDRVTWQPEHNVRQALVVKYYKTDGGEGYVAAGRSLREVEKREDKLFASVIIGLLTTLTVTFLAVYIFKT